MAAQLQKRNLIGLYSHQPSNQNVAFITSFVYSVKMDKFASIREAEMHEIVENIDAANTKKQTNTAVRTFREYLTSKHMSLDFESLSLSLLC